MKIYASKDFIFYYGSMGSGKTALLLRKYYNCTQDNDIPVLLLKPSIDDRYGEDIIQSRMGIYAPAISIGVSTDIISLVMDQKEKPQIIMLDEIQFLNSNQIEQLKDLAFKHGIAIDSYGLKINFRGNLFGEETGTVKKLLELCTQDIYVQSFCSCGNDAKNVARYDPKTWKIQTEGPEILIAGNNRYIGLCRSCWESGYVPRPSRLKIYTSMYNEEKEKGENCDISKLGELKNLIRIENLAIIEQQLLETKQIGRDAAGKVKELTKQLREGK